MHRRDFLASAISAAAAAHATTERSHAFEPPAPPALKGRVNHSVCRWCYSGMSVDDLCRGAKSIGIKSVELLYEKEWHIPAQHGLACAVAMGPTAIAKGLNRVEQHDAIVAESDRLLPLVKAASIPNMIVFSGNRAGISDEEGLRNCATGLKRMVPLAEKLGVTLVMELLNSKVDHKDYQCDRTAWGVDLVKRVNSPRFRLLYDIYHMQIMEGDVIRTIRDNLEFIAHYHTGGVPGRNEIDADQELQYPAICRALLEKGYTGYLGQEFVPKRDPMTSLREAVTLCDV